MENNGVTKQEIMVSVICLAYNHERFIRDALDGFVNQKTTFKYEVIVHDDASTDHTAEIIKEYEEKYPNIIKPIYQTENQYSKKTGITNRFIFPKAKGKYLAWCEGDDFWVDNYKLQKQVDALENNDGCVACFSKVAYVDIDGHPTGEVRPILNETKKLKNTEYMNYCIFPSDTVVFPFQISGFMLQRRVYAEYTVYPPEYKSYFTVGDVPLFWYVGLKGDVYYINDIMSHYRTNNPLSWHGKRMGDQNRDIELYKKDIEALDFFDRYTSSKYHEAIENAIRVRKFRIYSKTHDIKGLKSADMKPFYAKLSMQRIITHYIYHYFPHLSEYLKSIIKKLRK